MFLMQAVRPSFLSNKESVSELVPEGAFIAEASLSFWLHDDSSEQQTPAILCFRPCLVCKFFQPDE
jgi:hypothetical protein